MDAAKRRENIRRDIREAGQPLSASALAARYGVSRQIVVGDIALLRASGEDILATPRGYLYGEGSHSVRTRIACRHDAKGMKKELHILVDEGCTVLDVSVEHPIYGELTGSLMLKSRHDVAEFMKKCESVQAMPLAMLTEGIHLHTIEAEDQEAIDRAKARLEEAGIMLK